MAPTIRKKILDLYVERMRGVVANSVLYASPATIDRMDACTSSGSFSGSYPRQFSIEVTSNTPAQVTITETTLWRELHASHPVVYIEVIDYTPGTPFEVDGTGVSLDFSGDEQVGDEWLLLVNSCSGTINQVYPYYASPDDAVYPRLVVYPSSEQKTLTTINDRSDNTLTFYFDIQVDASMKMEGTLEDLIGDVVDEINRDPQSYDNSECLSYEAWADGVELYDSDSSPSVIGAVIVAKIQYRHQFNNTRIKR